MSSLSKYGTPPPHRVILVGSGVYGASLAYWLSQVTAGGQERWAVTVLERSADGEVAPDGASHDLNKIVRADYDDANYRALGKDAIRAWRDPALPWSDFYHEVGVVFRSGHGGLFGKPEASEWDSQYVHKSIQGAAEADEASSSSAPSRAHADSVHVPPLAYHLHSPETAAQAYPSACRPHLGTGVATIGARRAGDGRLLQDAWVNPRGGWAEAGAATRQTLRVAQTVTRKAGVAFDVFPRTQVASLLFDDEEPERVLGVTTEDGRKFSLNEDEMQDGKSCVVLCTGSWTRDLLERILPAAALRQFPRAVPMVPTAQAVITVQLTPELAARYDQVPVTLSFGSGFYSFAPTADGVMKAAIHSVGYRAPRPSRRGVTQDPRADAPPTFSDAVTQQDAPVPQNPLDQTACPEFRSAEAKTDEMLAELGEVYPEVEAYARACLASPDPAVRARVGTRLCHYSDTRNEDWLIDFVPGVKGLVCASGDSGHGFKFLPNIGRLIAARLGAGASAATGPTTGTATSAARVIDPLTAHQERVFSFAFHNTLVESEEEMQGADSNRFSGLVPAAAAKVADTKAKL